MANRIFGQWLAIAFKMKKTIFFIILMIFSLMTAKQVMAVDYNSYCTPGVCWPQNGGTAVFYDQCTDYRGYCAGTGAVATGYCSCREGGTGYAGGCSCNLNYNGGDGVGPGCFNDPNAWGRCIKASFENDGLGGLPCDSNDVCRAWDDGAYPLDTCYIDFSSQCKIDESPVIIGCCYGSGGGPSPTTMPIPSPISSTPSPTPGYISPTPTPTGSLSPTPTSAYYQVTINVKLVESDSASLSDNICIGPALPLYLEPSYLNWGGPLGDVLTSSGTKSFTLDATEGMTFDLQAWPQSSNYGCSCASNPTAGFENRCFYGDVEVPPRSSPTLNLFVYFGPANHPESWFQTFGSGAFARNSITSIVPVDTCAANALCQPSVFVPRPTQSSGLSSGFALLGTTNYLELLTDDNDSLGTRFQNLHWTGKRDLNQDAFALGLDTDSFSYGYDYFYQLANNSSTIRTLTAAERNLTTMRSNSLISGGGETDYFLIDESFNLNETNNFLVQNGESVVVFINGDLIIDNQGELDNTAITKVARKTIFTDGGFLAFIVNGDITINSTVGKIIDPNQTGLIQAVTYSNTHLEGVYLADETITVNSQANDGLNGGYPDRKLIAAGTFIGLLDIDLNRRADDPSDPGTVYYKIQNSYQALENFIYRPDLLINWPDELKSSIINWREVAPRSLN